MVQVPACVEPLEGLPIGMRYIGWPLDRIEAEFLAGQVSDSTRATLEKETADPQILGATLDDPVRQVNIGLIAGLVLGSPEFQKR